MARVLLVFTAAVNEVEEEEVTLLMVQRPRDAGIG
jgi:hypothetical protein